MKYPYFQVPNSIFKHNLSAIEKMVLIYLIRCSNNGKVAFPCYLTIARNCGICRRTAIKAVRVLEIKGYIAKHVRLQSVAKNYSNYYKVSMDKISRITDVAVTL